MPRLTKATIAHALQYWWVLAIGLTVLTAVLWAINRSLPAPRFTHPWLDQFAGTNIRVGDQSRILESLDEPVSAKKSGNIQEFIYRSKKNPNLTIQFDVGESGTIEAARFPVTLEENVKLTNLTVPVNPFIEYWSGEGSTEVVRLYPDLGLGLTYHFATLTVIEFHQFLPEKVIELVTRRVWIDRTEKVPAATFDEYAPNQPDFLDPTIDITEDAVKTAGEELP